ncbi:zinc dependent phospholipase C family protein [Echinicola vietnamensis]|uniref:S1/P1 Nuclease n=1 Tax=Echinicola vietnamensis (strain DSM 17526 / LMG 23754 / KMM 6221) TaxID=926556 RepID=L0FQV2_ECHVK|nr:zinc dependent phospholipase C family protein [Echinicola vietnamensis]AGA76334.1 S1/P1 Nuclease [Echinicola vietnamensis DSM 17526]
MKRIILFCSLLLFAFQCFGFWGFYAHKRINRLAVFSLPLEMIGFYKENIAYLTENAVNPDRRRYAVKGEAEKHYIDADVYGDSAVYTLPRYWSDAVNKYGEDSLRKYGIAPWNVQFVKTQLTKAFKDKNAKAILRLSADLGHYIGDINVPLHTTENYNGQLTGQEGIHGFWESRIPELLSTDFDLFIGKAAYIPNTQMAAWEAVIQAHEAMDSVLHFEKQLSKKFSDDKKYSFEERGTINTKVYSKPFTIAYNQLLDGQVERQMKRSIKMIADFWYTAWVDAGQPDLSPLLNQQLEADAWESFSTEKKIEARDHDF